MARQKLTEKTILATRATAGERIELWDELTPGLCLRVSSTGDQQKRIWVWRYRTLDGRQPRLTLADYSDQHGLKWARHEVESLRVRVRAGEDPAGARRLVRAKAKAEPLKTFDELADAFVSASEKGHWRPRKKQKRERTIKDEKAILARYVRPKFGKLRLEQIDRRMIRQLLAEMIDRGIGAQTNRTHAVIRQVFSYAVKEERLPANPASGIDKPASETPRSRVLTDSEIRRLWGLCVDCPDELRAATVRRGRDKGKLYVGEGLRLALRLTMLLLPRRNEIAGMALSELNLEQRTWLIPAERMKGGLPHLVPLPPLAVELIKAAITIARERKGADVQFVFPSSRKSGEPIQPDAISHAMGDLCAVLGIEDASPHDLRRTVSTILTSERLGVSQFIRSKLLAHSSDMGGGAAVSMIHYDANEYVSEKRKALEAWEGLISRIVAADESLETPLEA